MNTRPRNEERPPPNRAAAGGLHRRRTAGARASGALSFAAFEIAVWTSLYGLYLLVRGLSIASPDEALGNARSLAGLERALGLLVEPSVQDAGAPLRQAASYYYLLGFAPLLTGVLIWLAVHERNRYRELRSLLLLAVGLALIAHLALPVAPPRLVPEFGIADSVGLDRDGSSFAGVPYNPYAAMPSMHVGWSLLVGILAFYASQPRAVRWFFAAHPLLMALAVTVTGNHFLLDSLAGVLVALAALGLRRVALLLRPGRTSLQPACAG